jgi:hypothetical protein
VVATVHRKCLAVAQCLVILRVDTLPIEPFEWDNELQRFVPVTIFYSSQYAAL